MLKLSEIMPLFENSLFLSVRMYNAWLILQQTQIFKLIYIKVCKTDKMYKRAIIYNKVKSIYKVFEQVHSNKLLQ